SRRRVRGAAAAGARRRRIRASWRSSPASTTSASSASSARVRCSTSSARSRRFAAPSARARCVRRSTASSPSAGRSRSRSSNEAPPVDGRLRCRPRAFRRRGPRMRTRAAGYPISITGLGCYVPERVLTNDEIAGIVDTSDEWISSRTGIKQRRVAAEHEAMSDLSLPAARRALEQAGVAGSELDVIIVATVTPDMAFPATAALLADELGSADAAAYDLSAGCTGFMYAIAQAYGMLAAGLAERALVVGGDILSRILDWTDR